MMAGGVTCRSKHRQSTISPALLQLASSYSLVLQRNMPIAVTSALNQSINSHPFIVGRTFNCLPYLLFGVKKHRFCLFFLFFCVVVGLFELFGEL